MTKKRNNTHVGAETAASLAALLQGSSLPRVRPLHTLCLVSNLLQLKTHHCQDNSSVQSPRLPSALSKQALVLAEAGRVLSSKSVQAATFSSFNDTPHSQIHGRLAPVINHGYTQDWSQARPLPGFSGPLTTAFPW